MAGAAVPLSEPTRVHLRNGRASVLVAGELLSGDARILHRDLRRAADDLGKSLAAADPHFCPEDPDGEHSFTDGEYHHRGGVTLGRYCECCGVRAEGSAE